MKKKPQIPVDIFRDLQNIFGERGWSSVGDEIFDRFCDMLETLSREQQECVLELTSRFLRLEVKEYPSRIKSALSEIDLNDFKDTKTIFITPLLPMADYRKTKSSSTVAYLVHALLHEYEILANKDIKVLGFPAQLDKDTINCGNGIALLVDDFIGTGETAAITVDEVVNDFKVNIDKVYILTLVAQIEGFERIQNMGVKIVSSLLRSKGISDRYPSPRREDLRRIMTDIEDRLNLKNNDYRFGYLESEALVKMIRTPDNTFPIYWCEPNNETKFQYIPPFLR